MTDLPFALASLEKDCPTCNGSGILHFPGEDILCHNCGGTGKVAVLPGLRVPCPCIRIPGDGRPEDGYNCRACFRDDRHQPEKCNCQGRNWMPTDDERVLHQEMNEAGFNQEHIWMVGGVFRHHYSKTTKYTLSYSNNWLAAVAALKAAGHVRRNPCLPSG